MSRRDLEQLEGGKFRRKVRRKIGIFVDGVGLDRATRRLHRKVDLSRFMASLTAGLTPELARYYTLVPYEDDARQFAFLEAVERAGLEVCLKRLPPKTIKRPVTMDVHLGIDMILFCLGISQSPARETYDNLPESEIDEQDPMVLPEPDDNPHSGVPTTALNEQLSTGRIVQKDNASELAAAKLNSEGIREVILVCPNRELSYALYQCHALGVRTSLADFGLHGNTDGWRGVDTWIDLAISETIWRD